MKLHTRRELFFSFWIVGMAMSAWYMEFKNWDLILWIAGYSFLWTWKGADL